MDLGTTRQERANPSVGIDGSQTEPGSRHGCRLDIAESNSGFCNITDPVVRFLTRSGRPATTHPGSGMTYTLSIQSQRVWFQDSTNHAGYQGHRKILLACCGLMPLWPENPNLKLHDQCQDLVNNRETDQAKTLQSPALPDAG